MIVSTIWFLPFLSHPGVNNLLTCFNLMSTSILTTCAIRNSKNPSGGLLKRLVTVAQAIGLFWSKMHAARGGGKVSLISARDAS